jgi:hypothetical protein
VTAIHNFVAPGLPPLRLLTGYSQLDQTMNLILIWRAELYKKKKLPDMLTEKFAKLQSV